MDKLKENGFFIKYIHPNTLFISWKHWVPSYVRSELKKKTGIVVDEYGNKVETDENKGDGHSLEERLAKGSKNEKQRKYNPIDSYKPQGNLVYDTEMITILEDKFT